MKITVHILLVLGILLSFATAAGQQSRLYPFSAEYDPERTLLRAFPAPPGYERSVMSELTPFTAWLTNLPLGDKYRPVVKWNNQIIFRADSINGVIDLGITSKHQRDADLPLQFAMEFLRVFGKLEQFPIILSPKDTVSYERWLNGKYRKDARQNLTYKKGKTRESTEKEYYRFIEFVMRYNENKTFLLNLNPIEENDVRAGDLFIQFDKNDSDSTGHTAMILDICKNKKGDILLLSGWGGNPARSFYVSRPWPVNERRWFTFEELNRQLAEFGEGKLYRFKYL